MDKTRIILYFTATGNSLFVARSLAGDTGRLLSIPQLIKDRAYEVQADEIGIVCPTYGHKPPHILKEFLAKATLKADYLFAVFTYGSHNGAVVEAWDEYARGLGYTFDYISTIIMVDNWLPGFDMDAQMKMDKHIPAQLQAIAGDIAARKRWLRPMTSADIGPVYHFPEGARTHFNIGGLAESAEIFTVTDACVRCGICVGVCPRGNYTLGEAKSQVSGACEQCLSCIQNCPEKAIQFQLVKGDPLLDHPEKNPHARYRNPHVSVADIKISNNQR